jgi:Tol biopolymer transport system component
VSPPRFARALITEEGDGGELNVGPALSADGTHVAFLSERDRLSIDIYLADATTGQIKTKLSETASDPHFDSLQFIASAGAWDPSGRQFAVGVVRAGQPTLAIFDIDGSKTRRDCV